MIVRRRLRVPAGVRVNKFPDGLSPWNEPRVVPNQADSVVLARSTLTSLMSSSEASASFRRVRMVDLLIVSKALDMSVPIYSSAQHFRNITVRSIL